MHNLVIFTCKQQNEKIRTKLGNTLKVTHYAEKY